MSWGSSSMESLRISAPKNVRRSSSLVDHALSSSSLVRMLRNFSILKGFLFLPMRVCAKKMVSRVDMRTPMAMTSINGESTISADSEIRISKKRLINALYSRLSGMSRMPIIWISSNLLVTIW